MDLRNEDICQKNESNKTEKEVAKIIKDWPDSEKINAIYYLRGMSSKIEKMQKEGDSDGQQDHA